MLGCLLPPQGGGVASDGRCGFQGDEKRRLVSCGVFATPFREENQTERRGTGRHALYSLRPRLIPRAALILRLTGLRLSHVRRTYVVWLRVVICGIPKHEPPWRSVVVFKSRSVSAHSSTSLCPYCRVLIYVQGFCGDRLIA